MPFKKEQLITADNFNVQFQHADRKEPLRCAVPHPRVRHMNKPFLKIALALTLTAAAGFAFYVTSSINPYLYTKVYGDAGTERLHQLYRLSKKGVQVTQLREFTKANQIVLIEHERERMFSAHNDSGTNSEEVHVWYSHGIVTHAAFIINNP